MQILIHVLVGVIEEDGDKEIQTICVEELPLDIPLDPFDDDLDAPMTTLHTQLDAETWMTRWCSTWDERTFAVYPEPKLD